MTNISMRRSTALLLAVTVTLGGCATTGQNSADKTGASSSSECNPAIAAGVGAVIGGLLGGGTNTLRGAAIGAAIGGFGCMLVNYRSEQVKTAEQAKDDYKLANKGQLPNETTIVSYTSAFKPSTIRAGNKAEMDSYVEVVNGRNDPNPKLEEEMSLYKPDGTLAKSVRKPVSATGSSGGFRNSFIVPMPEGVPDGVYPVKTALFLNGVKVKTNTAKLQIVLNEQHSVTQFIASK
ncbi:MAG: hypothetical protein HOP20_08795 [Sulfuriferula sp.]|nr:hypothetical protein [Sulfuriferula sp.]